MTIAVGMLCEGGALVCADTQLVMSDGSTTEVSKTSACKTRWGSFGIANAGDDGNAASTLVGRIGELLEISSISDWGSFQDTISHAMEEWSAPYPQIPETSLIVAAYVRDRGVGLYLCQPPNTVVPKSIGYVAVGAGSAVTDPLQQTLFASTVSRLHEPQKILREISYLMYKAKKGSAYCGKRTQGVYVRSDDNEPEWIQPRDFDAVEKQGEQLDVLLRTTTQFALFSNPGTNLD